MNKPHKRTSPLVWIMFALVLAFLLLFMVIPLVLRPHGNRDLTSSVHNARNAGLALLEFEQEYERFPDASTAEKVRKKTAKPLPFAFASANDYLAQLIAAEIVPDSSYFYAKTAFTKKRVQQRALTDKSIDAGEVGFGYLMNGKEGLTMQGDPGRASLCAPLAYNGKSVSNRQFDPDVHDGKAVILRLDGSVQAPQIHPKTKTVMLGTGRSLLDTGAGTIWGADVTPVIVPPLPAR